MCHRSVGLKVALFRVTLFAGKLRSRNLPDDKEGKKPSQDPSHEREEYLSDRWAALTGTTREIHTFSTGTKLLKPVHYPILPASWLVLALFVTPVAAETVTFNKDIAPLIFEHCSACHRPGEAGPFSLLSYQDVLRHAAQIVSVIQRRYMPPWLPEEGYGDFIGERRLTTAQINMIEEWVKEGTPEGAASDLPPKPQFTEGWQMGPPDLVVSVPVPYRVPAGGSDIFRSFVLAVNVQDTKYIRAIELRPGDKRLVHHANIWIDRRRSLRRRDGQDGQPGFPGMDVASEARSDSFDPDSHFLFWKPGLIPRPEPAGMAWQLDPETDLILNVHLLPSGREETIQPVLGLYFSDQPPRRFPMLIQLEHDGALDIPPGVRDFSVSDSLKLPVDVDVLAIYPHAHYLGKQIEAWATLPDGTRRWLIKILNWDFNWQSVYTYREPVSLPKGAIIEMRMTFDNSGLNPRNPNSPPKRVRAGAQSNDEMSHVWLQVLPKKEGQQDPRIALQQAVMRRRLDKYPGDFVAHCNLGALEAMQGDYMNAISDFGEAVKVDPASATARSGLGASLLADGRVDDGIRELRETLRIDPAHFNARWNLAKALIAKKDLSGAAAELENLLRQKPRNADAQYGLGLVYFMQNRYTDALPHLEEAARLKPNDASIQTNLGAVLARAGDLSGAIRSFEQALKLDPGDKVAGDYLERARAALPR
jgi:Flp pilus assembly protein TadD/mono/diheme cytochrome c family protein